MFFFLGGGQLKHVQVGGSPSTKRNPISFFLLTVTKTTLLKCNFEVPNLPEVTVTCHGSLES